MASERASRDQAGAPIQADYLIMTAAFRYALGRQSYIVGHVADWIIRYADCMPEHDALRIIKEIDEQAEDGSLGMDMDKACWRRVQEMLRASLTRDGGAREAS